jgi:hypothetical protein
MILKVTDAISEALNLNKNEFQWDLIEESLIYHYGSHSKANIEVLKITEGYTSSQDYSERVTKVFMSIPVIKDICQILNHYNGLNSITDTIDFVAKIKEEKINIEFNCSDYTSEVNKLSRMLKIRFAKHLGKQSKITDEVLDEILAKTTKHTLKKTREELGYPDSRTFNPWLIAFFDDKYVTCTGKTKSGKPSYKSKNKGYINFNEYLEIVSMFLLSENEEYFDLENNALEYRDRIKKQKVTQKKVLKELTKNDYKLLRERVEDVLGIKNINTSHEFRNIPFRIVSIIKNEIKNYND